MEIKYRKSEQDIWRSPGQELLQEVAPGKNRLIYLWCHLTAVHDAMLPLLGFGKRLHPEFDAAVISNPDKTQASVPSVADIGNAWKDVNNKLFLMEFALHGLAEYSLISKHNLTVGHQFKDLLSNLFSMPKEEEDDEEGETFGNDKY